MKEPGSGRLIGIGVGPGDPELLTLKAARMLAEADVVAHFAKAGNASNARRIVNGHLRQGVEELPLLYPMTTELPRHCEEYGNAIRDFYDNRFKLTQQEYRCVGSHWRMLAMIRQSEDALQQCEQTDPAEVGKAHRISVQENGSVSCSISLSTTGSGSFLLSLAVEPD